jgi:2-polyprenyl-6-methoxyphenol hydroxylase-like FAD-dependent oxidoreductase
MKFKAMFPGHPDPDGYNLAAISPYKIHQRLVEKMAMGRFLLAADAAHICNPFGGLGLTGGLVDIEGLYECMIGVYQGLASPAIFEKYSDIRRQKFQQIVDPISTDNIKRLYSQDPDKALETDEFLKMLKGLENDEKGQVEFMRGPMALMHDFTQYYDRKGTNGTSNGEKNGAIEQIEHMAPVGAE